MCIFEIKLDVLDQKYCFAVSPFPMNLFFAFFCNLAIGSILLDPYMGISTMFDMWNRSRKHTVLYVTGITRITVTGSNQFRAPFASVPYLITLMHFRVMVLERIRKVLEIDLRAR